MPIIRGEHEFEENYTQLPNRWLRDEALSLKAIGLLAQLHSHSVGWRVSVEALARANNCGLEAIRSAIRELEDAGYLKRSQSRTAGNQFAEAIWTTVDPKPVFPSSGFPSSGFPSSAQPSSENPTLKNNNIKKTNIKNNNERFSDFWELYPRKVGKATAEKAFAKAISETGWATIEAGVRRLISDPNLPPLQFIPHPTTWLNRQGWTDMPYPERIKTPDEIQAEIAATRAQKASAEREASLKFLAEQKAIAERSAPPPLCPHNLPIIRCDTCVKEMAKSD